MLHCRNLHFLVSCASQEKSRSRKCIQYDPAASVVCQSGPVLATVHDSNRGICFQIDREKPSRKRRKDEHKRKRLSPAEVAEFKCKSCCKPCRKFEHWPSEQQVDGSLPASVPCTARAPNEKHYAQHEPDAVDPQKKTLLFSTAALESSSVIVLSALSSNA